MNQKAESEPVHYSDKNIPDYLESLRGVKTDPYYLLLLAGPYKKAKEPFLKDLEKSVGELAHVDLRGIVSPNEEQTYKNIDAFFDSTGTEKNIYFFNGDVLCGEYTAYTYSGTRYATPQSRYLLKAIQSFGKMVILDFKDVDSVDKTLHRMAHKMIRFEHPISFFDKLLWRLNKVTVHGHEFSNKRFGVGR
ncbi:MAG: hypothetical protein WEA56_00430 [Balneolaceae bacterium]